jgi:hypothetical protein
LNWLLNKWLFHYEKHGMYKANPCDSWAFEPLRRIGKALAFLGGECACCAGARVLLALAVGIAIGVKL